MSSTQIASLNPRFIYIVTTQPLQCLPGQNKLLRFLQKPVLLTVFSISDEGRSFLPGAPQILGVILVSFLSHYSLCNQPNTRSKHMSTPPSYSLVQASTAIIWMIGKGQSKIKTCHWKEFHRASGFSPQHDTVNTST